MNISRAIMHLQTIKTAPSKTHVHRVDCVILTTEVTFEAIP